MQPLQPLHTHLARLLQVGVQETASFASARKTAIRKFACLSESDVRRPVFLIVARYLILSYRIVGGVLDKTEKRLLDIWVAFSRMGV